MPFTFGKFDALTSFIAVEHGRPQAAVQRPKLAHRPLVRYNRPAIKSFFAPLVALAHWLIKLFDPPPLDSLNLAQKTGRVVLLTTTLVIASILFAMLGALGLFVMEKGRELGSAPQFYQGLVIILVGIAVNLACVFILLQIKRADTRLIVPPTDREGSG